MILLSGLPAAGLAAPARADNCVDLPFRMAESFTAGIVECADSWNMKVVEARGDRFVLHLEAHLHGMYWYQPVKAYFADSPSFDGTSGWGGEEDADRRFDYATFRGDLLSDPRGVMSCFAVTRHSSPYEGRGVIAQNLIVGIYCDDSYGEAPVPAARINQIIDAIEFNFE